jgi:two-component system sensor histidine kinase LytS
MGLYGKDAELKISSDQNGTQVVIQIPYKEQV